MCSSDLLVFPKPLEKEMPLIVTVRENTANVFALDAEGLNASMPYKGNDHSIISKVKVSRNMQLSVQFPPTLRPKNVDLKVFVSKNKEDVREQKYARKKFFYDAESGLAKFRTPDLSLKSMEHLRPHSAGAVWSPDS